MPTIEQSTTDCAVSRIEGGRRLVWWLFAIGLSALIVAAGWGWLAHDGGRKFFWSYLVAYLWTLTLGVGAIGWVTLEHLVNAEWSIGLRRIYEAIAHSTIILLWLILPFVVGFMTTRVHDDDDGWSVFEHWGSVARWQHLAVYLDPKFFILRCSVYLGFWAVWGTYLLRQSRGQDNECPKSVARRLRTYSAPAMLVFVVTVVFAATDIMALVEPKWKSGIFGFYFLSGAIIAALAAGVVAGHWVQSKGLNRNVIKSEHYRAIGKLLFSFTVLWAYLGFCQLLPIWYRNASEAMVFYAKRSRDGWRDVIVMLVVTHFVVPVVAFLCRDSKRNCRRLLFLSVWMLVAHYLDLYCLIMPNYEEARVSFGLLDLLCWLGCAALFFAEVLRCSRVENTIRFRDPSRRQSLAIES